MQQVSDETLGRLVDAVVREVRPEAIYLFGSRARGDARPDSDADLLIVEREPFGPERSRWDELSRLWRLAAELRMAVDLLVYSRDEVAEWESTPGHVINDALTEGRALYVAS